MAKLDNLMKKIENKANSDAQEAIRTFRKTVEDAAKILLTCSPFSFNKADYVICLQALVHENHPWPHAIWKCRQEKIQNEIMQSMDMLSRTLATPEVKSEFTKAEEE